MKPHAALLAGLAAGIVATLAAIAPADAGGRTGPAGFSMGGRAPGIVPLRPGMRVGNLPRNGRGLAWAGRHRGWNGGFGGGWCCDYSVPAVSGTMFPGWTAFQAPSAFGPWGGQGSGPSTVVNVNLGQPVYTTATLPTAADLPKVGTLRQPVGAPVLYVLNGSGAQRQGGARVIHIGEPKEAGATSGSGFSTDSPTNPKIVELTTE
jgi:hypothetical protein